MFSQLAHHLTMIPSAKAGRFEGAVSEEKKMSVLLFNLGISLLEDTNYIYRVVLTLFWVSLKVHKREKFFGSDFEFFTILLLINLKY